MRTLEKWLKGLALMAIMTTLCAHGFAQSVRFEIVTNMGTMRGFLYDATPGHRDAFVKLVKQKHFDGTLFYRVVKDFVIQGGSSDSRNARPGQHIGYGDEAVNIDSEFTPKCYHKFGALCAPRQPDKVNVFKTSDVSQFYIVRGRVYTDEFLTQYEKSINNPIRAALKKQYYTPYKAELEALKESDPQAYKARMREIRDQIDMEYRVSKYKKFTDEQRADYTTVGGAPQLDNEYTVFGEITEGLDVMVKINNMKVDANSRPLKDVKMTVRII
ncbi:MAG: peptidylprolyl isomerase [Bacteroidales bacterium]|nr:peptidylprolyl isomerase [Bacteroidales bacterium]